MLLSIVSDPRRAARLGIGLALRYATAPLRGAARTAMRVHPGIEPRLAAAAWLWQPGWGRGAHERLYRTPDPYGMAGSPYEQAKYDLIVEALAGTRYRRGLEVGCGEGLLSVRLAELGDELVAVDISETAIRRARERAGADGRVRFERRTLPVDMPEGDFDMIACSDVLYYWEPRTLESGMDRLLSRLRPGGRILLLHYLGKFGQAGDGASVHALAAARASAAADLTHVLSRELSGMGPGGAGVQLDVIMRRT